MTAREFCYWLQGYFELAAPTDLSATQLATVKNHLNMVFKHEIDPSAGSPEHQAALNDLHSPNVDSEQLKNAVKEILKDLPAPPHSHFSHGDTKLRC